MAVIYLPHPVQVADLLTTRPDLADSGTVAFILDSWSWSA